MYGGRKVALCNQRSAVKIKGEFSGVCLQHRYLDMENEVKTPNEVLSRLVGVLAAFTGICISVFVVWMLYKLSFLSRPPIFVGLIFIVLVVPFAIFFLNAGLRLTMSMPNAYGSILSPLGWVALGIVLIVNSLFLLAMFSPTVESLVMAGMGISCFWFSKKVKIA